MFLFVINFKVYVLIFVLFDFLLNIDGFFYLFMVLIEDFHEMDNFRGFEGLNN